MLTPVTSPKAAVATLAIAGAIAAFAVDASCQAASPKQRSVENPATAPGATTGVATEPISSEAVTEPPQSTSVPGELLGPFRISYYYIAEQGGEDESAATRWLYTSKCKRLAKVERSFARRLVREGTGRLRDGRVVGARRCGCSVKICYAVADDSAPWGLGVRSRPLSPFRSVSTDKRRFSVGTSLYVEELDGKEMPGQAPWGSFVHDGCVTVDDRGGGIRGRELDFFTGTKTAFRSLDEVIGRKITVRAGGDRCASKSP